MQEEEIQIHERLSVLETDVKSIKDNHLAHIWDTIQKLDERLWVVLGTIVVGFLATIVLNYFSK